MIGVAVLYVVDPARRAVDTFAFRVGGVTVEEAREISDPEVMVMWTAREERFSEGFRAPSPYCRFFLNGEEVVNPYAFFQGIPERPERGVSKIHLLDAFDE